MSMPTETKKMAPNRFFTGSIRCSIFSPYRVSLKILPMMKAPRAAEKPTLSASTTMPRHRAIAPISKVSLLSHFDAFFSRVGSRNMPDKNQSTRKNNSFRIAKSISVPAKDLVRARVLSKTSRIMATRSSTIRIPITNPVNCLVFSPSSSKALKMMVVEEMAMIPPRKTRSIKGQPNKVPAR